jgi:hypothetical protein
MSSLHYMSHCIVTHDYHDNISASCFRKLLSNNVIRGLSAPPFFVNSRHCSHSADKKREICQVHPSVYMRLRDVPDKLPYFFCSKRMVSTKRGQITPEPRSNAQQYILHAVLHCLANLWIFRMPLMLSLWRHHLFWKLRKCYLHQ